MIEINNVSKKYKNNAALDNVSLKFESGKIYGLLGRNGAGKSTLINIISNRIFADEGTVNIDGLSSKENLKVREKIFCMSETDLYNKELKVKNLYKWTDRFYDSFNIDKAFNLAKMFGLDTNKSFKALSKGYQSIFKATIALSLDVPHIIYDEPVLGLDANNRDLFYDLLLKDYQESERTIIIATHLIEEVANIIEEAVLIEDGKILLQENVASLLERAFSVSGSAKEVDEYCKGKNVLGYDELAGMKIAYILDEKVSQDGLPQSDKLTFAPINLQKLFVKLTGKGDIHE